MTRGLKSLLIALLLIAGLFFPYRTSRAQSPVVYAVLFYSPTCPHCEYVITEVLPPLLEKYGDQLQIIGVNVQDAEGGALLKAAASSFGLDRVGVPFLVVGDRYLMGSVDIPGLFPGLIEQYLSQGGVDWPAIPGLTELLAASQASEEQSPTSSQVVPAVLFYRSSCSHCQKVVEDVLTPLMEKYGSRLQPAAGSFKTYEPLPSERAEAARAGSSGRTPAALFTATAVTDAFATARPDGSVMRPVTAPGPSAHTWAERPISNPQSDTNPALGALGIVLGGLGSDLGPTPLARTVAAPGAETPVLHKTVM